MKFLPDSAIVGTFKRLKNAGKPRNRKGVAKTESKEKVLASSNSCFNQDSRTFEQLLAEARRHAKSGK